MKSSKPKAPSRKTPVARRARPRTSKKRSSVKHAGANLHAIEVREIESLQKELDRLAAAPPPRWNADPEDVRRSVGKLVLTLVEFIRQLLERQAIRRMDAGTLTAEETEAVGLALMRLEETVTYVGAQFGLEPGDLTLDLGPVGKLL